MAPQTSVPAWQPQLLLLVRGELGAQELLEEGHDPAVVVRAPGFVRRATPEQVVVGPTHKLRSSVNAL